MSNEEIKKDFGSGSKQAQAVCFSRFRKKESKMTPVKFNFNVPIQESLDSNSENFIIDGIAINPTTTSNNHKFVAEELEASAETLNGVPLLKDHKNEVDSVIGKVLSGFFNHQDSNVKFKALIDPEQREIKRKINLNLLNSVSVGAIVKDIEENDEGELIPRGITFKELSLVAVPADPGATFGLALKEAYQKVKEDSVDDLADDINNEEKDEKGEKITSIMTISSGTNTPSQSLSDSTFSGNKQLNGGKTMEEKLSVSQEDFKNLSEKVEVLNDLPAKIEAQTELISKLMVVKEQGEVKEEEKPEEPKEEKEEPKEEKPEEEKPEEPKEEKVEVKHKKKLTLKEEKEDEEESEEVSENNKYKIVSGYGSIRGGSFTLVR